LKRELNKFPETKLVPFIFLTGHDDADMYQKASELGIDDFLIKPIRKLQLRSVVKRVLTREKFIRHHIQDKLEKEITAALEPKLPKELGRFRTCVHARAAEAGGGDFISYLNENNNNLIVLADVMGHGTQAKFFAHAHAGYLNGLIRTLEEEPLPAKLLSHLSTAVNNDPLLQSVIMTCVAVKLNEDGIVKIASAGHPKPLIIKQNNTNFVNVTGSLPGINPVETYQEQSIDLSQGGRLVFYTDGLMEIGSSIEERQQSELQMLSTIKTSQQSSIDQAGNDIMNTFDQLTATTLHDDATLIMIEYISQTISR